VVCGQAEYAGKGGRLGKGGVRGKGDVWGKEGSMGGANDIGRKRGNWAQATTRCDRHWQLTGLRCGRALKKYVVRF